MGNGIKKYDVIVIGGGGGTKLIRPVADLNLKVAVVEMEKMGGTCLNRGCIPSKMLIQSADVALWIERAKEFFIDVKILQVHFSKLVEKVNRTIDQEADSIPPLYAKHPNIDLYQTKAKFLSSEVIEVGREKITADKIFLAIGTRAYIPDIEGLKDTPYMSSKQALREAKKPKRIVIIGGGYIAAELGFFYRMLGVEVHIITKSPMLQKEDIDIQKEFEKGFSKLVEIHKACEVQKVEYENKIFSVIYTRGQNQEKITSDSLLVATGIKPWTDQIGIEKTDIQVDKQGFIRVDEYLQTTQKNVWAFGDCIGRYLYRHSANYEGEYLFRTLIQERRKTPIVYPPMPHAIFSFPRIGSVGMKEEELKEKGISYVVGLNRYCDSARGMALHCTEGFVKLLFDAKNKRLIGGHCIGDEASNLVHMIIAYMKMKATLDDLIDTIYIHPTLPELIRNAAKKAKQSWNLIGKTSKKVDLTE